MGGWVGETLTCCCNNVSCIDDSTHERPFIRMSLHPILQHPSHQKNIIIEAKTYRVGGWVGGWIIYREDDSLPTHPPTHPPTHLPTMIEKHMTRGSQASAPQGPSALRFRLSSRPY